MAQLALWLLVMAAAAAALETVVVSDDSMRAAPRAARGIIDVTARLRRTSSPIDGRAFKLGIANASGAPADWLTVHGARPSGWRGSWSPAQISCAIVVPERSLCSPLEVARALRAFAAENASAFEELIGARLLEREGLRVSIAEQPPPTGGEKLGWRRYDQTHASQLLIFVVLGWTIVLVVICFSALETA